MSQMPFRFDRFLSLLIYRAFRGNRPTASSPQIPILMYHSISQINAPKRTAYYETVTTPDVFRSHLQELRNHRFKSITMDEYPQELKQPAETPRIAITFDDGFLDFYTTAFPLLSEFGFNATVFIPTSYIESKHVLIPGCPHLSWKQARELQSQGICFGSHTANHKRHHVNKSDFLSEVRISKSALEENIMCKIHSFSYPYAFPEGNRRIVTGICESLEVNGYTSGVTTRIGVSRLGANIYTLPRQHINNFDDSELYLAKITGCYDWMRVPQLAAKMVKQNSHVKSVKPRISTQTGRSAQ